MGDKSVCLAQLQAFYILAVPGSGQQDLRRKVLSSRTRRSGSRAAAPPRLAAATAGRTGTAPGAFYRRLSRVGKAKAVTAPARKIAVLFYNSLRNGMDYRDPGAAYDEERHRRQVLSNLQRRATALGYVLQEASMTQEIADS